VIAVGSDELRSDGVWDFPGVEAYRRSGAAPSSDQSLAPSDLQYEMERKKPVWIVLVFFA
jgi:hypothetical protein